MPGSVWGGSALGALPAKAEKKCPQAVFLDIVFSRFLGQSPKGPWSTPLDTPRHTLLWGDTSLRRGAGSKSMIDHKEVQSTLLGQESWHDHSCVLHQTIGRDVFGVWDCASQIE